jgi:hypothetical protein
MEVTTQLRVNTGNRSIRRIDLAYVALASSESLRDINRYRVWRSSGRSSR